MFMELFDKVQVANFEVASDAFATFKVWPAWCRYPLVVACKNSADRVRWGSSVWA